MAFHCRPIFDELTSAAQSSGAAAALERLADELRAAGRYRELFSARQMQVRQRLGLPLWDNDPAREADESLRTRLEEGYLAACREVGGLLLAAGRIRESWPYWNVLGDKPALRGELAKLAVTDDNVSEFIEVALYEGVWPERGVELLLAHNGTCNTITTLDGLLHSFSPADRSAVVSRLVRRVHADLIANVRYDIERQQGQPPAEPTLAALVADRDWLFTEHSYHLDTSHLSATVRLAKVLEPGDDLRLAVDLTEYGRRLSPTFQFAGEPPFADFYPSHGLYLRAMLGEDVDAAVAYFCERAEATSIDEDGTSAIEFYVALLDRVGRPALALEESVRLLPTGTPPLGIAPSVVELAAKAGRFDRLMDIARERDDPVSFAIGCLAQLPGGLPGGAA